MFKQVWIWVFGKLQVKILLLVTGVMFLLLTLFTFYDMRIQRQTLEATLRAKAENMALTGATVVGHLFEDALITGRLTENEVFDTDYQPISNTDPQKYHTAYDSFTDATLQKIQDTYLEDGDVLYAVAVDQNGYLPTHNNRYTQPLIGDYEIDLVGNRTKRIFDDPVGLTAAKNTKSTLQQIYYRDTGEVAWDISAPIWVRGRHWGAFRVGISIATIDSHIAEFNQHIALAAVLVALAMGLAVFLITRQVVRPLQSLVLAARRIGQGDLDVQVEVRSRDEIGQLAGNFNAMAGQIRNLISTIEEQSAAQVQRLERVATLTEQFNAVLDFDRLLQELVHGIKENFDYYHVQVYTIDESRQNLVLAAAAGEAGAQLIAQSQRIPLSSPTSLVARAGWTGQIMSVGNVRQAKDWQPHPLLPDTRAEMAIPITLDGQLRAVLDVLADDIDGLDEVDASMLRSLTGQVTVMLRNIRLFAEIEQALADARAVQAKYLQRAWDKSRIAVQGSQHLYLQPAAPDLPAMVWAEARRQALQERKPILTAVDEHDTHTNSIVAPLILGNETIGAMQLHRVGGNGETQIWTEEDLALVETVLDQVAQTAENLRLFDETRRQANQEQAIREVTDRLRAAPDLQGLVAIATQELSTRLGATHAKLKLGSNGDHTKRR